MSSLCNLISPYFCTEPSPSTDTAISSCPSQFANSHGVIGQRLTANPALLFSCYQRKVSRRFSEIDQLIDLPVPHLFAIEETSRVIESPECPSSDPHRHSSSMPQNSSPAPPPLPPPPRSSNPRYGEEDLQPHSIVHCPI